jgi:diaminohydroxyphosphoribosylaminopyrimidine deaminase/5-amino-6-(5-phosphoribosylamino)uracil reductase
MEYHEKYMRRCIELAEGGMGNVAPNPLVGCVITCNDKIIGEGFHRIYGESHAEVNAIKSIIDKSLLSVSTLYVNLEPCSHYGKTPPCADAIIAAGIPKIVIGNVDCNEKVCGKGIEKLRNAGCEVISNVLDIECEELNKRFFVYHKHQRPYIILKWARSADGYIDIHRKDLNEAPPARITSENLRQLDHKWRTEEAAIMIGTNTAFKDDPQLTARSWTGKNPVRIVIDADLKLSEGLKVFDNSSKTIIFNGKLNSCDSSKNNDFIKIDFDNEVIFRICSYLRSIKIMSVIVEGGCKLLTSFIRSGIWDEARIFTADNCLHDGVVSPAISGNPAHSMNFGSEKLEVFLNKK